MDGKEMEHGATLRKARDPEMQNKEQLWNDENAKYEIRSGRFAKTRQMKREPVYRKPDKLL
jgi:hypothetical protein